METPFEGKSDEFDVIVIGAGVSGLEAARQLVDTSKKAPGHGGSLSPLRVVVLESSDYVGGRCKMETFNGITVPTGAHFLHGERNNPIYDLGLDQGWDFTFEEWPDRYYVKRSDSSKGVLVKALDANNDDSDLKLLFEQIDEMADVNVDAVAEALGKHPRDVSLRDHLVLSGVSKQALDIAAIDVANDMCSELHDIGLREMYEEAQHWSHGERYVVINGTGGFQPLIDCLAYGPKDMRERHRDDMARSEDALDIRLNSRVVSVEYDSNRPISDTSRVKVATESGKVFHAAHVISTTSLPVLVKTLTFSPPLFDSQDEIVREQLGMFHEATRVFMAFREKFWPNGLRNVIAPGYVIPEFGLAETTRSSTGENVYLALGFATSKRAAKIDKLSDQQVAAQFLKEIDEICGTATSKTPASDAYSGEIFRRSWSKDTNPHTLGAYSAPNRGSLAWRSGVLEKAAKTNGCVFLIGEGWNLEFNTCVQGAMKTGTAAAKRIMEIRTTS